MPFGDPTARERALVAFGRRRGLPFGGGLPVAVVPIVVDTGVHRRIDILRRLNLERFCARLIGGIVEERDRGPSDLPVADREHDLLAPIGKGLAEIRNEPMGDPRPFRRRATRRFGHRRFRLGALALRVTAPGLHGRGRPLEFPPDGRQGIENERQGVGDLSATPGLLCHGDFLEGAPQASSRARRPARGTAASPARTTGANSLNYSEANPNPDEQQPPASVTGRARAYAALLTICCIVARLASIWRNEGSAVASAVAVVRDAAAMAGAVPAATPPRAGARESTASAKLSAGARMARPCVRAAIIAASVAEDELDTLPPIASPAETADSTGPPIPPATLPIMVPTAACNPIIAPGMPRAAPGPKPWARAIAAVTDARAAAPVANTPGTAGITLAPVKPVRPVPTVPRALLNTSSPDGTGLAAGWVESCRISSVKE